MWNYTFMVPCALVMVVLLAFYASRRRLPLRLNSIFSELMIIQVFVFALDIVSTMVDERHDQFGPVVLYVANMLFFVVYLARVFWFCRFSWALLGLSPREHRVAAAFKYVPISVAELVCITSAATGAVFSIQNGAYVSGPFYHLLAITYVFYIGFSVVLLLHYRDRLRPRELMCALGFNAMLLVGTVARVLFPRMLIMDTFCVMALLIIYLAFANPDIYLLHSGMAFNLRGFRRLMGEPERQHDYHLLGFALQNYTHERSVLGGEVMDEIIDLISEFLRDSCADTVTFYMRGGRFVLLGDKDTEWGIVRAKILTRFLQPWQASEASIQLSILCVYTDSKTSDEAADRMVNNLIIALDNAGHQIGGLSGADDANPLSVRAVDQQVEILRALEDALANDRVEVYLQPILSSATHDLVGAEALARIRDTEGNIISPNLFIPIAEKRGYIHQVGRQVLEKTCRFLRENDVESLGIQWVNVNLSPLQCIQHDLPHQFFEILKEHGVSASKIHFEITEQSMIDYTLPQRQIAALQDEGFQFVLDDYGTGYSNFARVKHYPFITIKLDMEVVWDYYRERDDLLPIIVQGFKQMGLSLTAEGIESADMAGALTEIGCDYLQGYYFSEPVPQDVFLARYGALSAC